MDKNPLQQYFRRPALYLKLPSNGAGYPEGSIQFNEVRELPVYPMTAIDDITAKTPDSLFNGTAVAEIIKSCIPGIKNPWDILSIDMDAILIAIKAASGNGEMEVETECPSCEETSKYGVNLSVLLNGLKPSDYSKPYVAGELKIKFKPLSYKEGNDNSMKQFEFQRMSRSIQDNPDENAKNQMTSKLITQINQLSLEVVAQSIEYIETPTARVIEREYINDFMRNCDKQLYNNLREYSVALKENSEIKPLDITCGSCQHQYKQPFTLNVTDFFD